MLCYIYFDPICPNKEIKSIYHHTWQNNLHVQIDIVCLNILVKIYPHLSFLDNFAQTGAELGRSGGELPCPFLKIKKSALILEKKCPDCVHPQVKFAIQNVVLRVSKRKNYKIFPCGDFFLDFLIKCLSKCPNFAKPPLRCPEKFLVVRLTKLCFVTYFDPISPNEEIKSNYHHTWQITYMQKLILFALTFWSKSTSFVFPGQFCTKLCFVTCFISICHNKEIELVLHRVHFLNGLFILILITVPVALKKYKNSIKNTL